MFRNLFKEKEHSDVISPTEKKEEEFKSHIQKPKRKLKSQVLPYLNMKSK